MIERATKIRTSTYFHSIALALFGALVLCARTATAQTRVCDLAPATPPLTLFVPGDSQAHAFSSGTFTEVGPFLTNVPTSTTISCALQFNPPESTTPAWLLAPIFETMGDCEGPPSFPAVGDGGRSTHDFGSFGTLIDDFSVTNAGQGADPTGYHIRHVLSGNLDLRSLLALDAQSKIDRVANITLNHDNASGTIDIVATPPSGQSQTILHASITATYTTAPAAIPKPIPCVKRASFTAFDPASGLSTGTVTRTYATAVPTASNGWLALLGALIAPLGFWAIQKKSRPRH